MENLDKIILQKRVFNIQWKLEDFLEYFSSILKKWAELKEKGFAKTKDEKVQLGILDSFGPEVLIYHEYYEKLYEMLMKKSEDVEKKEDYEDVKESEVKITEDVRNSTC